VKHIVKWLAMILASAILLSVIGLCWVWHRTEDLELAFERVQRGDSQARVVELFDQPPYVTTDAATNTSWDGAWADRTNRVTSVCHFHFYPPLSICAESWEIGFADHSNAVTKFHIVSP